MISTIEKTIEDALKEAFNDFEVYSCPVDFDLDKFSFSSPKGCILTRYESEELNTQNTLTAVNSDNTYNFSIFMALRYLQYHSEAYPYTELLKQVLNGLPILNKRLVLSKLVFELENSGDLWYSATVNITLPQDDKYSDESNVNTIMFI